MLKLIFPLLCVPFFSGCVQAQSKDVGTIEFLSDKLSRIIDKDAKVEVIAEGFQFTEGPLWVDKERMLLFSDVPANTVYKWTEEKGKEVYLIPSGYTASQPRGGFLGSNGLQLSNDGRLLLCQHGDRRIAVMNSSLNAPVTTYSTVAGTYNGKQFNSPNDLYVTKKGAIYFTDPSYGFEQGTEELKREIPFQGVYKVNTAGQVELLVDSVEQPNGIGMMPDEKTLLVSNSDVKKKRWYAYDIGKNGALKNARVFYDVSNEEGKGGCDGFKIDKSGNVFASGPGGVWIFDKGGQLLGRIKLNDVQASNCALTPDNKTLFITATQYILRVKMR